MKILLIWRYRTRGCASMNFNIYFKYMNKYLIPGAVVIAGALIAGAYIFVNFGFNRILSSQEAGEKAINFINQNIEEGAVASLVKVTEKDMVYQISLTINGNPYESYITKDGQFMFPTGVSMKEFAEEESAQTTENTESTAVASEAFAKCLTEKGMKFYGSKSCSWCAKEKEAFGDALQYVDYVECVGDDGNWAKVCQDAQITSVPTWQSPDGTKESGYKTLEQLAEMSGCSL